MQYFFLLYLFIFWAFQNRITIAGSNDFLELSCSTQDNSMSRLLLSPAKALGFTSLQHLYFCYIPPPKRQSYDWSLCVTNHSRAPAPPFMLSPRMTTLHYLYIQPDVINPKTDPGAQTGQAELVKRQKLHQDVSQQ